MDRIVGVCADTRYASLRNDPPPVHFNPYRQQPEMEGLTYVIRTPMKAEAIVPSLRAVVRHIDPNLPLLDIRTSNNRSMPTCGRAHIRQSKRGLCAACAHPCLRRDLRHHGVYGCTEDQRDRHSPGPGREARAGAWYGAARIWLARFSRRRRWNLGCPGFGTFGRVVAVWS